MIRKSLKTYAALYCIIVAITASAAGQAGHLDSTFGTGGIATQQTVITQLTNVFSVGGVAIQGDGKIVVVGAVPGNHDFNVPAVLRFLSNGNLDTTFGANGVFVLPSSFGSYATVAIQSDGKILADTNAQAIDGEVDRLTTAGPARLLFRQWRTGLFPLGHRGWPGPAVRRPNSGLPATG